MVEISDEELDLNLELLERLGLVEWDRQKEIVSITDKMKRYSDEGKQVEDVMVEELAILLLRMMGGEIIKGKYKIPDQELKEKLEEEIKLELDDDVYDRIIDYLKSAGLVQSYPIDQKE